MTLPSLANLVVDELVDQFNISYAGHLDNRQMLCGIGLAQSMVLMLPWSITTGASCTLETYVSQAFGNKKYRLCGLYLLRHFMLVSAIFAPVALVLSFS